MLELAYNSSKQAATGFSLFDLLYVTPQNAMKRLMENTNGPPIKSQDYNGNAEAFLEMAKNRLKDARNAVHRAVKAAKKNYNDKHAPLTQFKPGDYAAVKLDKYPLPSIIKRSKLTQQMSELFKVLDVLANGRAFKLDFPASMSHSSYFLSQPT